ncbi:MAG: tRNA dihydrouridine synthase DusB [Actinomycetota bacterium]|nr:tRNA dihydrouridine synthase DusB [Actinomycetota bacterium]
MEDFKLARLTGRLKELAVRFLKYYKNKNLCIRDDYHNNQSGSGEKPAAGILNEMLTDLAAKNDKSPLYKIDSVNNGYSFKIGNLNIKNPVITAPLAGISDNTYRIFAGFFGSALNFTEMITSYGIHYGHKKSIALSKITDYERPCALQLFGSNIEVMEDAAVMVEDKADIIDINMGCPVPKILKSGSGGYLMQDEDKTGNMIKKISSVLKKPLTIKTRIGWDRNSINILNIAKIAESAGAAAISIHGRTVKQGFSGEVDYGLIRKVKESVKIPVIASGDINSSAGAKKVLDYTGCDGIMIGRKAKGRLWFLMDVLVYILNEGDDLIINGDFEPDMDWKKEFAKLYLEFLIYFKGEKRGVKEFRKHLCWIFKGTRGINKVKGEFFKIEGFREAARCIENL